MNAGVSGFVRARLLNGSTACAARADGVNGGGPSSGSGILLSSGEALDVLSLSPFRLLSWLEERKKRSGGTPEPFDAEPVRARVREYLGDEDWRIRNVGVKLAGLIGYREALPALLGMLRDRTPDTFLRRMFGGDFRQVGFIRRNILKSIGDIGLYGPEVRAALIGCLRDDPYYEARSWASSAIRRLSDQVGADAEIVRALVDALKDPSFEVVMEATLALGKVGGEEVVGTVFGLYDHRLWRVREAALQTTRNLVERGVIQDAARVEEALDNLFLPCPSFKPNFPLRAALRDLAQALTRLRGR